MANPDDDNSNSNCNSNCNSNNSTIDPTMPTANTRGSETEAVPAASASASVSASVSSQSSPDDWTMAQVLQAMEILRAVYGFSGAVVSEALEMVTTTASDNDNGNGDGDGALGQSQRCQRQRLAVDELVAACCDWILDHGLAPDAGGPVTPIDDCPHVAGSVSDSAITAITSTATSSTGKAKATDIPDTIFESRCCYYQEPERASARAGALARARAPTGGFKDALDYDYVGDTTNTTTTTAAVAVCHGGENWWCLRCGGIYCSRYVNGHGVEHYRLQKERQKEQEQQEEEQHCVMVGLADLSVWCHECGAYLETRHHAGLESILDRLREIKFGETSAAATTTTANTTAAATS